MLENLKSLYPSLIYRLFHAGVFDTAENRNQPIHIVVFELGNDFRERCKDYQYESVTDVPFELLQMACFKEPSEGSDAYCLSGMPIGIEGSFVLKYKSERVFAIRSLLASNQLPVVGIVVNRLQDDLMEVMYPSLDYSIERLPQDVYGKEINGAKYFKNMNEFLAYVTKEKN